MLFWVTYYGLLVLLAYEGLVTVALIRAKAERKNETKREKTHWYCKATCTTVSGTFQCPFHQSQIRSRCPHANIQSSCSSAFNDLAGAARGQLSAAELDPTLYKAGGALPHEMLGVSTNIIAGVVPLLLSYFLTREHSKGLLLTRPLRK